MKTKYNLRIAFLTILAGIVLLMSCSSKIKKEIKVNSTKNDSMLCVGAYWTEADGNAFVKKERGKYTTADEWRKHAKQIRAQILKGAGLEKFPKKCPLNPILGEKRKYDGYQVQNVAFESLPGVYVTGSLYTPLDVKGPLPGILSPHGHWPKPDNYGRYRPDAQKRFAVMARMGAMVFAYDMVGYGQLAKFGWIHKHSMALKQQLWNSIRSIDFILSMGADSSRIGITGASGGATQTIVVAAVDDRITVSAPVVMVSAYFFGGCVCESGMPIHKSADFQTNNVEIAACVAPRPLLLVSDGDDWTKNTPNVEYPHIQYIYGLFNKKEMVFNVHLPNDKHGYDYNKRAAVYPFMANYLGLDLSKALNPDGSLNESTVLIEDTKTLYPFDDKHPFPADGVKTNDDVVWQ